MILSGTPLADAASAALVDKTVQAIATLIWSLVGLPADMMLTLSLTSRLREILSSLPGLLLWQHVEGQRLWRKRPVGRLLAVRDRPNAT